MQKIKFRFNENHMDSFNTPGVLNLMFLDLTNQCNLRCLYCFNKRILGLSPSHMELEWKDKMDMRLHPCGAGQFNLKITSKGKVSACICQDSPEFIVGDLLCQDIEEIWNSPEINHFRSL